jgi:FkbM family methyltransferase
MVTGSFTKNILTGLQKATSRYFNSPYKKVNINWFKLKILKHQPAGKLRHHTLHGKKVFYINPQEFLHGLEEIFIDEVYLQKLPQNAYVIDCGSNIGLSIIYIKQLCPSATVIGFEPDEKNYDLLQKNLQSLQLTDVILHKAAVWTENKLLQFTVTGTMGSSISSTATAKTIPVEGIRLKDLLIKKVDFLKIDIEGAEYDVLKDIESELKFVQNLFIEYHGSFSQNNELTDMLAILVRSGFNYYIKEATSVYDYPLTREKNNSIPFDVQLNIFCTRKIRP